MIEFASDEEVEQDAALVLPLEHEMHCAEILLTDGGPIADRDRPAHPHSAIGMAKARRLQAHILTEEVQRGILNKLTAIEAAGQDEPSDAELADRLLEWAQIMTSEGRGALVDSLRMSVPADPAKDFDLVLVLAAKRLLEK